MWISDGHLCAKIKIKNKTFTEFFLLNSEPITERRDVSLVLNEN